ncbi:MAG: hypothetical protein JSS66_02650 [Armatimonadetes bacterium]|nr:hypothetical protein [Armatimonadota bacterium]
MRNLFAVISRATAASTVALGMAAQAQQAPNPSGMAAQVMAESATAFRENRGQWDSRAMFLSQAPGMDYWVTKDGVVIDYYSYKTQPPQALWKDGHPVQPDKSQNSLTTRARFGNVVQMSFVGAGTGQPVGYGQTGTPWDYLVGKKGQFARGVKSYRESVMANTYSGVDVRHYRQNGSIRYDVVVRPGADPNQVAMKFTGAGGVRIGNDGAIYLITSLGKVKFGDLKTYQPVGNNARQVASKFVMRKDGTVGVQVGQYDPRLPLVIDPLVYGSYVGSDQAGLGQPDEIVQSVAVDLQGNLFMTGVSSSPYFPTSYGAYDRFLPDGVDTFVMKMDADAYSCSYAVVLGGSGTDTAMGIGLVDSTKKLYVGGTTDSTDFGGANNGKGAGKRVWMGRFDISSDIPTPEFTHYVNEAGQVGNNGIRFDDLEVGPEGNIYLGGQGTVAQLSGDGFTNVLGNAPTAIAAWVLQVLPDQSIGFKRMIGGLVACTYSDLAVARNGNIAVCGSVMYIGAEDTGTVPNPTFVTTPGVFPGDPGQFNSGRYLQNANAYAVQMNVDGDLNWSCVIGGAGDDFGQVINYDRYNNVYVVGASGSFNYQRTRNAFDQFPSGKSVVTKLSPDAGAVLYSTAMRSQGPVIPTAIAIDDRGVAAVGGVVSFINIANPFDPCDYQDTIPGVVYQTADALNVVINKNPCGLDRTVNASNGGQNPGDAASGNDGFITFVNPSGTDILYSDYIGNCAEEQVTDVIVDGTGSTWVAGLSQMIWTRGLLSLTQFIPRQPVEAPAQGVFPYITNNAFKVTIPVGGAINLPQPPDDCPDTPVPGVPEYGASNGWIVKLRVKLPILSGITLNPSAVAGGNGVSSTATVTLRDPAPPGGVNVTMTLDNTVATSFDQNPGNASIVVNIAGGTNSVTVPVYTFPVTAQDTSEIRANLDNDFVAARLTISPWLNDFTVSPASIPGGNQMSAKVILFQVAPVGGITVPLATDKPALILLGSNPSIQVPENAQFANAVIDTAGVDQTETATISASYLGVVKDVSVSLTRADLASLAFNPSRVNSGDTSVGTLRLNGKTGSSRNVTISLASGPSGALVNGAPLPATLTIPPQTNSITFTVTAPGVASSSVMTLKADDGTKSVFGNLTIDPIDIASVQVQPSNDVIGGTVLTGQVVLTRPAGANGFTVNLSNSNANAGTLSQSQVTIPAGQIISPNFTFRTAIRSADQTTNIHATKSGFTDRYVTVKVRAVKITMTMNPTSVVGGVQNAIATLTLSAPAPVGGLLVTMTSSDTSVATVPDTVTIPGGQTVKDVSVVTRKVPTDKSVTITATAAPGVGASKNLLVTPPAITGFSFNPSTVTAGGQSKGTLTFETGVASGTVVTLTASPSTVLTMPSSLNITAGLSQYSFFVTSKSVLVDTVVTVTARLGNSQKQATLTVRIPSVLSLTFNPARVTGGGNTLGKVTLDAPAPPGGVTVTVTSGNTNYARIVGSGVVVIPQGSRTGTFQVTTSAVSRTVGVIFTGTFGSGGVVTGTLFIDP